MTRYLNGFNSFLKRNLAGLETLISEPERSVPREEETFQHRADGFVSPLQLFRWQLNSWGIKKTTVFVIQMKSVPDQRCGSRNNSNPTISSYLSQTSLFISKAYKIGFMKPKTWRKLAFLSLYLWDVNSWSSQRTPIGAIF